METFWNTIIWQQFGAAIDMLEDAIEACPDDHWTDVVWDDPDAAEYGQFWFVAYHTLMWLDLYLSGVQRKDFAPPPPFVNGALPDQPYTRADVLAYLQHGRAKCRATLLAMTDDKATEVYTFDWGSQMPVAELQLYTMRHVQEHASQLNLHVGRIGAGANIDWVSRAGADY